MCSPGLGLMTLDLRFASWQCEFHASGSGSCLPLLLLKSSEKAGNASQNS